MSEEQHDSFNAVLRMDVEHRPDRWKKSRVRSPLLDEEGSVSDLISVLQESLGDPEPFALLSERVSEGFDRYAQSKGEVEALCEWLGYLERQLKEVTPTLGIRWTRSADGPVSPDEMYLLLESSSVNVTDAVDAVLGRVFPALSARPSTLSHPANPVLYALKWLGEILDEYRSPWTVSADRQSLRLRSESSIPKSRRREALPEPEGPRGDEAEEGATNNRKPVLTVVKTVIGVGVLTAVTTGIFEPFGTDIREIVIHLFRRIF